MKSNWKTLAVTIATVGTLTAVAADDAELAALKKQISELSSRVQMLEHQQDNDVAAAMAAPKITLGGNGFSFSSADSNFVTQIHGLIDADSRSFISDGNINGNDGFLLRKARPIFTGTVFRDFDYNLTTEFGGSTVQIMDAYVNWHYNPAWQIQAGKFKSPVGLENLQSDPNIMFNERSIANNLIPNRDLGIMLKGDLFGGAASYAVGIFNGAPDYTGTTVNTPIQDDKAVAGRVFFQPWKNTKVKPLKGLGFGVGGSYEVDHPTSSSTTNSLTAGYLTDGQQKFFAFKSSAYSDGPHWRLTPQASYYYGPFGLMAEYVVSDMQARSGTNSADLQNTGWEVTASWLLTGEDASYGAITPNKPFDLRKNQWGALQLVARYGELDIDNRAFKGSVYADPTKSATGAQTWSAGLNWYLNKSIRANASFSHTEFDGPVTSGNVAYKPENVVFSRLQLAF
jgi:phosphate-selective porin OprO and OprP